MFTVTFVDLNYHAALPWKFWLARAGNCKWGTWAIAAASLLYPGRSVLPPPGMCHM